MVRPIAGDPPTNLPVVPHPSAPSSTRSTSVAPLSPFNYTNQPNTPTQGMQSIPTTSGLLNAFRRRWVLGTLLGVMFAVAAVLGVWLVGPSGKHEARAVVQIRSRSNDLGTKSNDDFIEYRNRQLFLLRSRDLLTRVVNERAVNSLNMIKNAEDPVQLLEEQLKVKAATDDILVVTLTGNNLEEMKVILEHLVRLYVADVTAYDQKDLEEQTKKLEKLVQRLQQEIGVSEKRIELLGHANRTTGGEDNAKQLALLNQQQIAAESDYNRVGRELLPLEEEFKLLATQLQEKNPPMPPDPVLVERFTNSDPRVAKAKAALDAKKTQLTKAIATAGGNEKVPYVVELKGEVETLQKEFDETKKSVSTEAIETARVEETAHKKYRAAELENTIKIKKGVQDKLKEENEAYKKHINQSVVGGLNIQAMRDALRPQKETLDKTNVTLAKLNLDANLGNRVTQRGEVEKVPNYNQTKKIIFSLFGGAAMFFGVVLVVAYLEWRTRRVDGVDQVVSELGMRVIGTVPLFPSRAGLQDATDAGGANWRFVLNESINSARTMLLHTARAQSMQVVMVTSATQGEGKTSLASQLATSMATAGMRTLVVDCDLRNPSIQKLFDLPLGPGVSEVLRQEIDAADAIQLTAVPNLWVIPAGQCSNATITALAQGHPLEALFNRLRGQFDFVIVDSCPVLPVADALLIGQHVDGVVFSIMQDVSELPKVMTASEKLTHLGVPLLGAVVNGIRQEMYAYGYNYVKQLPG